MQGGGYIWVETCLYHVLNDAAERDGLFLFEGL